MYPVGTTLILLYLPTCRTILPIDRHRSLFIILCLLDMDAVHWQYPDYLKRDTVCMNLKVIPNIFNEVGGR